MQKLEAEQKPRSVVLPVTRPAIPQPLIHEDDCACMVASPVVPTNGELALYTGVDNVILANKVVAGQKLTVAVPTV